MPAASCWYLLLGFHSSYPPSVHSGSIGLSLFLQHTNHGPTPGPLHSPFVPPGMLCCSRYLHGSFTSFIQVFAQIHLPEKTALDCVLSLSILLFLLLSLFSITTDFSWTYSFPPCGKRRQLLEVSQPSNTDISQRKIKTLLTEEGRHSNQHTPLAAPATFKELRFTASYRMHLLFN